MRQDKDELLTKEQVVRMLANLHNPRQDLVAVKAGTDKPIPYRHVEEVNVAMPVIAK
jgi:CxxC motif-containing protein